MYSVRVLLLQKIFEENNDLSLEDILRVKNEKLENLTGELLSRSLPVLESSNVMYRHNLKRVLRRYQKRYDFYRYCIYDKNLNTNLLKRFDLDLYRFNEFYIGSDSKLRIVLPIYLTKLCRTIGLLQSHLIGFRDDLKYFKYDYYDFINLLKYTDTSLSFNEVLSNSLIMVSNLERRRLISYFIHLSSRCGFKEDSIHETSINEFIKLE